MFAKGAGAPHLALYTLLIAMPASGALTWFGGIRDAADLHEIVFKLGLVIVVLHVLAALSHQFILKDGLLARIVPRFKG